MKYKIRFKVDLSGMNKQEVRDYKIELIQQGIESIETEIDHNIQLPIPKVGDNVVLSNKDFRITSMKYLINSEEYIMIFCVVLNDLLKRKAEEEMRSRYKIARSLI